MIEQPGSVRLMVSVPVPPDAAFAAFTADIDRWYRRGVSWLGRHEPTSTLVFQGAEGGHLLEVSDRTGRTRELARITVWEPGRRLVFVDWRATEVEVTFNPSESGTRVALEHRGLDALPAELARDLARYGWSRLAGWFEMHFAHGNGRGS